MGFQVDPDTPAGGDLASEAWGLLIPLVYPPRFLEIARKLGVTAPILGAMRFLDEPRTMGQMAELLCCDPSNVTGIVDALEAKGLAERRPSEVDRRVKVVVLTPKGGKLRARTMAEVRKPPPWLHGLSSTDQRKLRDVLRRARQEGG
jgi:DNA-binding MarR family transcriptional regulator